MKESMNDRKSEKHLDRKTNEALEEILSFKANLNPGLLSLVVGIIMVPVIAVTFGVDKLFKVNIRPDAYAGAIALATGFALVSEAIILVYNRSDEPVDRQTFFNLKITELTKVRFEDCYFENCTFEADLSIASFERCSFNNCRFSSKIDRSVEHCRFWNCNFSGATIDPGFLYRHFSRSCDFSKVNIEYLYPNCPIDAVYPEEGWIGFLSCAHNARSRYIRCVVNPKGPCKNCSDFTRPPVLTDVRSLFLDLPRRLRKLDVDTCWDTNYFDRSYDKYAIILADGAIFQEPITDNCYRACLDFLTVLDAQHGNPESEAVLMIQELCTQYEHVLFAQYELETKTATA
jgi:Family of unknown function (DUF6464)